MMRGVFAWLDAHPGFYWGGLAIAVAVWLLHCRATARRSAAGNADLWVAWTWLAAMAVVVAGRWPELFMAHGVTEEEARVVLGARALAEDLRPFRTFVFSGSGPVASAALLPTHWLGVPLDYFNARLVALLCDCATLGCLGWVLARLHGAGVGSCATGALALVLAWPGGEWAGAVAQHLCLCMGAGAMVLLVGRPWRGIDGPAIAAGLIVGLMPWVHRDATLWAFVVLVAGAWRLGEFVRMRAFIGAAAYSCVVFGAWVWGTGGWGDCWDRYVLAGGGAVTPTAWWREMLVVVASTFGAAALAQGATEQGRVRLATGLAVAGFAGIALWGRPAMLGQLAEHWRHPRIGAAAEIRALTGEAEPVAIWGAATSPLVEAGRRAAMPFAVDAESATVWQERWFDLLRRRETAVLLVADAVRPEKLQVLLQDHYRWESTGDRGQIYLRNARMFTRRVRQPDVVPISLRDLSVAEAYGGSVAEVGAGRISTHAPARLVTRVPSGNHRVAGIFGFYPDAYRHPGRTTDGGKFSVVWWRGSQREVAAERWLTPGHVVADRGAQEFDLEVPTGVDAVEFNVEPGRTMSFDWAYWGELRFARRP